MCGDEFEAVARNHRETVEFLPDSDPRRQLVAALRSCARSFLSSHSFLLSGDVVSFLCADTVVDSDGKHVYFSFHVDLRQLP